MWDLNEKLYGVDRDKNYDDLMTDITFFSGLCYSCKKCKDKRAFCDGLSLENITRSFRTSCVNLLFNCKWNGEPFECCDAFIELQSEFGICYTINSQQTRPQFGKRLTSNRESGPGVLEVITLEDVELYLHSTADIPSKNTDRNLHETILWGMQKQIWFNTQEIINEVEVEDTSIRQRKCQFQWELDKLNSTFEYYSYSTCMLECNYHIQLSTCGCVHHLMPKGGGDIKICDFEGLLCLTDNYGK